jgi:hypothetical protein
VGIIAVPVSLAPAASPPPVFFKGIRDIPRRKKATGGKKVTINSES